MWMLVVVTLLTHIDDAKVTNVEEFETQWECNNARNDLRYELSENEEAFCLQVGPQVPTGAGELY